MRMSWCSEKPEHHGIHGRHLKASDWFSQISPAMKKNMSGQFHDQMLRQMIGFYMHHSNFLYDNPTFIVVETLYTDGIRRQKMSD
jgi:hypothetical protein